MNRPILRPGRTTSPGTDRTRAAVLPLAGAILLSAGGAGAGASPDLRAAAGSLAAYAFCSTDLVVTARGLFTTSPPPGGFADFSAPTGLWVGAMVDRGAGTETNVSSGLYAFEFNPVGGGLGAASPRGRGRQAVSGVLESIQVAYADTAGLPDLPGDPHVPLGIEVVQDSWAVTDPDLGGFVKVKLRVENISAVYQPPGWALENVYVAIVADPDVGITDDDLRYWMDDQGGFVRGGPSAGSGVPPGAKWGDLAYVYDERGGADDVGTQFGVVMLSQPAHAFRVWSGGAEDPSTDPARYAMMMEPTIDPPTVRGNDYRILLSLGPIPSVAPGESFTFAVGISCGDLVPVGAVSEIGRGAARVGPVAVAPNPIRLTGSAPGNAAATFSNLPSSATVRVYSLSGRLVRELDPRGAAQATWDLRTVAGQRVPAGTYFYRIGAPGRRGMVGKLVVVR